MPRPYALPRAACRTAANKVVNTTDNACISNPACIGVANQVASASGDCEVCADTTPVRNIARNACIAATTCTAVPGQANVSGSCTACKSPTPLVSLDKASCIDSATCMAGGNVANGDDNACIQNQDMDMDGLLDGDDNCPNGINGPASTADPMAATADPDMDGCKNSEDDDDDNDGVTDASDAFPLNDCASVDTDGDGDPDRIVADCTGATLTEDTDDDNDSVADASDAFPLNDCASVDTDGDGDPDRIVADCTGATLTEDTDDDNDGVTDANDAFPLNNCASVDTDGDGDPDRIVADCTGATLTEDTDDDDDTVPDTTDNCPLVANTSQIDTDNDDAGDACDTDDDNDGVADMSDDFPLNDCASVDTDGDNTPDRTVAGCTGTALTADTNDDNDSEDDVTDIDDDNDGLIEIATASELNNMRHNLAGTTYDDEDADTGAGDAGITTGAPTAKTPNCATATGGFYLCGYELVADIDFAGADGDPATTADNLDENSTTAGNFDPIGNNTDGGFTALLEGNGHTIRNLAIDITGETRAISDANDAAFIASCRGSIRNITLSNAQITGRRRLAALCATMNAANVNNAHISSSAIMQSDSAVNFSVYAGGIAGYMGNTSSISNSSASAPVSNTSASSSALGGLAGATLGSSTISNSYATGDITTTSANMDLGGLVGVALGSGSGAISNSYATGDINGTYNFDTPNISNLGGLIGQLGGSTVVSNSYAIGDVTTTNSNFTINYIGGLVGLISSSTFGLSNNYATGDTSLEGPLPILDSLGGLVGRDIRSAIRNYRNNYWNWDATQSINGIARDFESNTGVGTTDGTSIGGAHTLAQILALDAATLKWDATLHWTNFVNGEHPKLRYADNPHTSMIDECAHLQGASCGDLLPGQ